MKVLVVLICVAAITVLAHGRAEDERRRINAVHDECQSDPATHLDEDLMKKLHKGEEVDKAIAGPHVRCMFTKQGLQKENGDIDAAVIRNKFGRVIKDEEKLNKAVEECAVQKSTPEESALALLKCVHDQTGNRHHGHHRHHHHHQIPNTL